MEEKENDKAKENGQATKGDSTQVGKGKAKIGSSVPKRKAKRIFKKNNFEMPAEKTDHNQIMKIYTEKEPRNQLQMRQARLYSNQSSSNRALAMVDPKAIVLAEWSKKNEIESKESVTDPVTILIKASERDVEYIGSEERVIRCPNEKAISTSLDQHDKHTPMKDEEVQ